jgi:cytochrome c2
MKKTYLCYLGLALSLTLSPLQAQQPSEASENLAGPILTYNNRPLGSVQKPLLMRTFMPSISLGDEVLVRHRRSYNSPKYNPKQGKDVAGEYKPIEGLTAAIGVNYGAALSYCWDTVECRLVYAWKGGFLDMKNYWGDPKRGNRQSYGYVAELVGTLFMKAEGTHPVTINGQSISKNKKAPVFKGYVRKGSGYEFSYSVSGGVMHTSVERSDENYSVILHYQFDGEGKIDFTKNAASAAIQRTSDQQITVVLAGKKLAEYQGVIDKNLLKGGINAATGEKVFQAMACMTCHSVDGSKSHGPSLLGIDGSQRKIKGHKASVLADDAYILESIKTPNTKVVEGFPENYMPPYNLKEAELKALLLYLKSLKKD